MMSAEPLFSIVVPACNVAPYATQMVRSIRTQSCGDFEAIIVIEASTDGTETEIRNAVENDPRFRIVPLPRSGSASVSRNYGIDHAAGRYVLFLDGDDWIEPDSLERFSRIIAAHGRVDIIMAGAARCMQQPDGDCPREALLSVGRDGATYATGIDALAADRNLEEHWIPASWINIFRLELLRSKALRQAPGRMHQDDEWTYRVFMEAGLTVAAHAPYYNYRCHPGSITNTATARSIRDRAANIRSILDYWRTHEIPERLRRPLANYFCKSFLHHTFFSREKIGRRNPNSVSRSERQQAFQSCLGAPAQFKTYLQIARNAKSSERIMIPVMRLARHPGLFPAAEFVFHHVYYPSIFVLWRKIRAVLSGPKPKKEK